MCVIRDNYRQRQTRYNQSTITNNESMISLMEEWDQSDFDELHPQLDKNSRSAQVNENSYAMIESRFLMHDLIKITSRKSSSKIITFYFRIPTKEDYSSLISEENFVESVDSKPNAKYQFAFKRKVKYLFYFLEF